MPSIQHINTLKTMQTDTYAYYVCLGVEKCKNISFEKIVIHYLTVLSLHKWYKTSIKSIDQPSLMCLLIHFIDNWQMDKINLQ